jgi:hypothetical protein
VRPLAQTEGHDAAGLVDELVPGVTAMIEQVIVGAEDSVGEPIVACDVGKTSTRSPSARSQAVVLVGEHPSESLAWLLGKLQKSENAVRLIFERPELVGPRPPASTDLRRRRARPLARAVSGARYAHQQRRDNTKPKCQSGPRPDRCDARDRDQLEQAGADDPAVPAAPQNPKGRVFSVAESMA